MSVTATSGELSTNLTTAFQNTGYNTWKRVAVLALTPFSQIPTVTFTFYSGTLCQAASSTCGRVYADAVRFVYLEDPCVTALPELTTVNGPLADGQMFVNVPNVSSNAVGVFVYADNVQIGSLTNNVVAGLNTVPLQLPLVQGMMISASQCDPTWVESCRATNGGAIVGGGPNPRIRVSLSIRQDTAYAGPIGADGGTATKPLKFLGATNVYNGGFGNAPVGGKVFEPSPCWQTVSFLRGEDPANPVDPVYNWASSDSLPLQGNFGVLESIAFAIEDLSNTGPWRIYLDNVKNGDTILQDFEGATNGQPSVLFTPPGTSGSTGPFLLAPAPGSYSPNLSQVTTENADTGNNSAVISWQFKEPAPANWLRLLTQGSNSPNPQVDLRLPISFRLLLLPVGLTNGSSSDLTAIGPQDTTVAVGLTAVLTTTPTGSGPFTYVWRRDGVELSSTSNSISLSPVSGDIGPWVYSVEVRNPCSSVTNFATVSLVTVPTLSGFAFDPVAGTFSFRLDSVLNTVYMIEYKNDLSDAEWTFLTMVLGDGSRTTVTDPVTAAKRFYRVRIP